MNNPSLYRTLPEIKTFFFIIVSLARRIAFILNQKMNEMKCSVELQLNFIHISLQRFLKLQEFNLFLLC